MMNKQQLKFVVVDDQPLALEILGGYLKKLDNVFSVMLFNNPYDALSHLEHHTADVLLLDIEMPQMSGIQFLKTLTAAPITIFTTAYRNYAYEGYELGVIDFLLKPITYERFYKAIEKVSEFLTMQKQVSNVEPIQDDEQKTAVFVKSGLQRIKLHFAEVTHIQGLKDYAIIYTASGKILLKGSIKAMLNIFPQNNFIRVHKSFIVSIQKITRMEKNRIILDGQQVPIGRNYKEDVERMIKSLF